MPERFFRGRRLLTGVLLLCLIGTVGCGPRLYPVRGRVTLQDGTPVTRGLVVFESKDAEKLVSARGEIEPDGYYELSTNKPGDGVLPGKYRVLVNPMDLTDLPDEQKNIPFDSKYLQFSTSGLEFEVKAVPNEIPIKLDRSRRGRR